MSVVQSLSNRTDWQLGTTRPTWAVLMRDTGLSRRTIARYLALLRAAGLLGVVATGRTAAATPMALDDGVNAAAVYVLTVPHALQLVIGGRQDQAEATTTREHQGAAAADPAPAVTSPFDAVDELGTPSPSTCLTGKEQPTHARCAREQNPEAARASSPSSIRDLTRAQLIAAGQLCDGSEKALWTTKGRRFLAAAELRRRDPVVGRLSTPDVASVLREWLLADWSIIDIQTALNTRPDGTPWPHQLTVAQIVDVRAWMHYRLAAWRTDPLDRTSSPGRSPSARVEAEQVRAQARTQARAEAEAEARATAAACPCPTCSHGPAELASPAATDMAAARARLRANRLTSKHRQA